MILNPLTFLVLVSEANDPPDWDGWEERGSDAEEVR